MGDKLVYEEKSYKLLFPSSFRIYEDRVEAYFWPYRHVIPLSDIEEVGIVEKISWYVGWGLRLNPFGRRMYFALHHGRSIEIRRRGSYWKAVVMSVKNPEKFVSTLKALGI